MGNRILSLLRKIEWQGASDYSIGIRTCPCCRRRGGVSKTSQWYEGHTAECELMNIIYELEQTEK